MRSPLSAAMLTIGMLLLSGCSDIAADVKGAFASGTKGINDPAGWRAMATPRDRARVRDWYGTWTAALADARAKGFAAQIGAEGALLDPQAALMNPELPMGAFRCRTVKIGAQGAGPGFIAYDWFDCQVGDESGYVSMVKTRGSQRLNGRLFPDDRQRLIFLGTLVLGDETMALDYGSDQLRDMAGIVERIGDRRWRIVLPRPAFESLLDVIELVPAE